MSTIGIPLLTLHLFRRNYSSNGSNAILQISWIADLLQGGESNVLPKLRSQLESIDRAPLKPQQRLFIIKQNVIPATYHQLVLGKVSKGLLKGLDCEIRRSLRKWLKLTHNSPNSYFYSNAKDGGLGVKSLRFTVPQLKVRRIGRLKASYDPCVIQQGVGQMVLASPNLWGASRHSSRRETFVVSGTLRVRTPLLCIRDTTL